MGIMVDGHWQPGEATEASKDGNFARQDAGFRDWVTADGAEAPEGHRAYPAAAGRYHLYVSYACPWAHRALVVRALKGLEDSIGVSVVSPVMRENGWTFATDAGGSGDGLYGLDYLWQLYARARPGYSGKVTVPVLWDRETETIVSNESAEIIRMLASAWDGIGALPGDFYPEAARATIDAINAEIYQAVNNGVYKAGFATTQAAYDDAVTQLFAMLDRLDRHLATQDWLVGPAMTEADIRLFTTLVRFDAVYVGHFKCNVRRIADYPALERYLERMLAVPAIAATVHLDHIMTHYYASHRDLNPSGIVPAGPDLPWAKMVDGSKSQRNATPPARLP
ncbi:glutathione S-transferase family protein [Polymorphobacter fuscus]|uniref:Glutathione S-transferase family protein n=1 Tax=Sandarakinorhabdus fusca TaxID=1439888 RepID=A0A7C9GP25_9SPHN|nr:glutathione S-transferase family protein [Polymorphobacter fuscus]KAB7647898.1 glutathione S-transferase family protein [Polymorphobacter fuscus]MQT17212.1 glutathione S-transferase family protein [Polymorphobacter fuscus]NJC08794.1 putative glutathione S-transferase [Polymorphobacter fuscus]